MDNATFEAAINEEIQKLVSPDAPVRKKDLKAAETILSDALFE